MKIGYQDQMILQRTIYLVVKSLKLQYLHRLSMIRKWIAGTLGCDCYYVAVIIAIGNLLWG